DVPINLGIDARSICFGRRRSKVIPRLAGKVGLRYQVDNLLDDRIFPVLCDTVIGKGDSIRSIRISGQRIVNGGIAAHVTTPHRQTGNRSNAVGITAIRITFEAGKKEYFIPLDWAAERPPELIHNELAELDIGRKKISSSTKVLVVVKMEERAMEGVSAALEFDVDRSPTCQALFSIVTVRDHINGTDRLQCRVIGGILWLPDVGRTGAVNTSVVNHLARPIHVEYGRPSSVRRIRFSNLKRRDSGNGIKKVLIVSRHRSRKVYQFFVGDLCSNFRAIGL